MLIRLTPLGTQILVMCRKTKTTVLPFEQPLLHEVRPDLRQWLP